MLTLDVCKCEVLAITPAFNNDVVIKINYPGLAENVLPGQYVHLSDDENIVKDIIGYVLGTESRQSSVSLYMTADTVQTMTLQKSSVLWISQAKGAAFPLPEFSHRVLLVADKRGLPSVLFLSQLIEASKLQNKVVAFLFSEDGFPFKPQPSQYILPGTPSEVIAACPLLEDRKIPSRLVCKAYLPGCYQGSVIEFFVEYFANGFTSKELTIYCCGRSAFVDEVNGFCREQRLGYHSIILPYPCSDCW